MLANWRGGRPVSRQLADAGDTAATQLLRACLQEPDPGTFTAEDFVRGEPPRRELAAGHTMMLRTAPQCHMLAVLPARRPQDVVCHCTW